jgi:hypothetical protein
LKNLAVFGSYKSGLYTKKSIRIIANNDK